MFGFPGLSTRSPGTSCKTSSLHAVQALMSGVLDASSERWQLAFFLLSAHSTTSMGQHMSAHNVKLRRSIVPWR